VLKIQEYSKEYLQQENRALPLSIIRINNLDSIKEKTLKFSDERLKELIFEDVKCYEGEFNSLLKKYHNMRVLALKNVAVIDKIG
jgi:c-di-AMP phosphodiesterase-like protein